MSPFKTSQYAPTASPLYQAVWSDRTALLPRNSPMATSPAVQQPLALIRAHQQAGTQFGADGKHRPEFLAELGNQGFWGLRIAKQFGGSELSFEQYLAAVTEVAAVDSSLAGLLSVHSCLGAAGAVAAFGSEAQQQRWLPQLASGQRLSAFALTEKQAGSDLAAIKTTAVREGSRYLITGEKVFITNADYGRQITLVALLEGVPAMFVVDLPEADSASFQLTHYPLHPLRRSHNRGLQFDRFEIPADSLLETADGKGLNMVYYGLNRGRAAVCAAAGGSLRKILAGMVGWSQFRHVHGQPLASQELILGRLARMAALIVGCDALAAWSAGWLDMGYRGELESSVAKAFASEALKEAAVDLGLKTHGGRALLVGHPLGDQLFDYLAPSIYEGESDLLRLGLMRTLLLPPENIPAAVHADIAVKDAQLLHPFAEHFQFAQAGFREVRTELLSLRARYGGSLPEKQLQLSDLAGRVQSLAVFLAASQQPPLWSGSCEALAADLLLRTLRQQLTGTRPTSEDFELSRALGSDVIAGKFSSVESLLPPNAPSAAILWPY